MALRAISISKILFDGDWYEMNRTELGLREQDLLNSSIILQAKTAGASVKVRIVGMDLPQKLVFRMNGRIRLGSGMIIYENNDLETKESGPLELNSLDKEL